MDRHISHQRSPYAQDASICYVLRLTPVEYTRSAWLMTDKTQQSAPNPSNSFGRICYSNSGQGWADLRGQRWQCSRQAVMCVAADFSPWPVACPKRHFPPNDCCLLDNFHLPPHIMVFACGRAVAGQMGCSLLNCQMPQPSTLHIGVLCRHALIAALPYSLLCGSMTLLTDTVELWGGGAGGRLGCRRGGGARELALA